MTRLMDRNEWIATTAAAWWASAALHFSNFDQVLTYVMGCADLLEQRGVAPWQADQLPATPDKRQQEIARLRAEIVDRRARLAELRRVKP